MSSNLSDRKLSHSPTNNGSAYQQQSSKRNKPCQQCQKLKVKCERNPKGGPCLRCESQKKECTYHEFPEKRRKRDPDERLDALEKTLATMRKSMEQQQHAPSAQLIPNVEPAAGSGFGSSSFGHPLDMLARTAANTHSPDMNRFSATNTTYSGITPPAPPTPRTTLRVGTSDGITTTWSTDLSAIDPVERGWIDLDEAKYHFERFWKHLLPTIPILSFGTQPPNFEQIRREEPLLFLSTIAAAASTMRNLEIYEKLHREALSVITYNAAVEGQKTSELLSSLLVLCFWCMAPSRFDQLKTYLHCHMCVGMAIDLSLQRSAKDPVTGLKAMAKQMFPEELEPGNRKENFTRPLEKERTWMAVFLASVGYVPLERDTNPSFAVGMRRPQTLEWTPHHTYCCQALTDGGQHNDLRLVQICHLMKLSQDISKTFCLDSRPKKLSDPSVYLIVKGYRNQLETWREQNPNLDEYVSIWYHQTNLVLYDVAIHSFHSPEDLRPPYALTVQAELPPGISDPLVSAAHVDCISKVVFSAQKLLDHMIALHYRDDGESLIPNLPTVYFARSMHAWITLVRVSSVGSSVCDESSLRIDEYLERLSQVLDEAATISHFHTAMSTLAFVQANVEFSWIFRILKQCYKHKKSGKDGVFSCSTPAQQTSTPSQQPAETDRSATASATTVPLDADLLAEPFDLTGQLGLGENIDWDALMNDGTLWNSIAGGWSDEVLDTQPLIR